MTDSPRRPFDYAAFRSAFHQRALARGIDPVEGATGYQAALVQAELRIVATLRAPDYGWWRERRGIFSEADERRPVEHGALHRVEYIDDADEDALVPLDADAIRELWREVRRECVDRSTLPLRTIHANQLAWAEYAAEIDREAKVQKNATSTRYRRAKAMKAVGLATA